MYAYASVDFRIWSASRTFVIHFHASALRFCDAMRSRRQVFRVHVPRRALMLWYVCARAGATLAIFSGEDHKSSIRLAPNFNTYMYYLHMSKQRRLHVAIPTLCAR